MAAAAAVELAGAALDPGAPAAALALAPATADDDEATPESDEPLATPPVPPAPLGTDMIESSTSACSACERASSRGCKEEVSKKGDCAVGDLEGKTLG